MKCSATSHDSKAEKRREVAIPPNTLPSSSTGMLAQCLVAQEREYTTQYNRQAWRVLSVTSMSFPLT